MYQVEDPIETIHLYVVREGEKRPNSAAPLLFAFLCLLGIVAVTLYSASHPYYEHKTLRIPAQFMTNQYTASEPIIPTGIKTYPATQAKGILTIYNGSVLSQEIPHGMILTSSSGIEVVTNTSVFVPAGNPPNFGIAKVSARTVVSGQGGNIPSWSINQVYGASLYIRNLAAFYGGQDSYSVKVITQQDRQRAINSARGSLTAHVARIQAILAKPCSELAIGVVKVVVTWTCQFVVYPSLPGMKVTRIRLVGNILLVDVMSVPRPHRFWVK